MMRIATMAVAAALAAGAAQAPAQQQRPPAKAQPAPQNQAAPRPAPQGPTIPTRVSVRTLLGVCGQDRSSCLTYVLGSADAFASALVAAGRPQVFCFPRGTTNDQIAQTAVQYMRARPQEGNSNAALVILAALQDGYRCGY